MYSLAVGHLPHIPKVPGTIPVDDHLDTPGLQYEKFIFDVRLPPDVQVVGARALQEAELCSTGLYTCVIGGV